MRRLLPDSIAGWVILVVITGLVASQVIAIAIHYDSRREAQTIIENVRIAEGYHAHAADRSHHARTAPGHRA